MTKQGKTTGNLKMRSGPGMQFEPPIAFLVPDTQLEILGEEGDWWKVRAAGKEGYVGKKYVAVSESLGAEVAAAASSPAPSAPPAPAAKETHQESREGTLKKDGRETGYSAANINLSGGRETGERGHKGVNEK